jgi:3-deoxy-manno-octulosonate cytidylyltransferase (CMP-KDO synthetase)
MELKEPLIVGIIPARYASTRFPAKPLAMIAGKSMIQRVYERSLKARKLHSVYVATDHVAIAEAVLSFGGNVIMTNAYHPNGTSRCEEAVASLEFVPNAVINIQGDEPIIAPEQIDLLADLLLTNKMSIATLCRKVNSVEELTNDTVIKVVKAGQKAIYFSRNCIPHLIGTAHNDYLQQHTFYKHIGLYGFKTEVLQKLVLLPESPLERAEQLEQLRWLENGFEIGICETPQASWSVDVPADIAIIEKMIGELMID